MELFIREFIETDREALRELFVVTRNAAFSWESPSQHRPEDFDTVTEGERILVAVVANRPIGFASVWEADSFLHNLFVHPQFQGRGAGRALLAACEQYFTATPTLKCLKANEHARQFYQQQGWKLREEAKGPDGPYLLMERVGIREETGFQPMA